MPRRNEIEVVINAKEDASKAFAEINNKAGEAAKGLKKLEDSLDDVGDELSDTEKEASKAEGVMDGLGNTLANIATIGFVTQLAKGAVELGKLGLEAQATQARFEAFAGGAQNAANIINAVTDATGGALSKMDTMAASTQLLSMGLTETADETAQVIKMATRLGDQTQDAGARIENFALLLANQSIPRLDSFGISASKVRNRIAELQEANTGMSRETAFMTAVMEEGAKSLETLGEAGLEATKNTDMARAAIEDLKVAIGTELAGAVNTGTGVLGKAAAKILEMRRNTEELTKRFGGLKTIAAVTMASLGDISLISDMFAELDEEARHAANSMANVRDAGGDLTRSLEETAPPAKTLEEMMAGTEIALQHAATASERMASAAREAAIAAGEQRAAFDNAASSLDEMSTKQFAQTQIQALREAGLEGHAFADAQEAILTKFGLLSEAEIQAQGRINELVGGIKDGTVNSEQFARSLQAIQFNLQKQEEVARTSADNIGDISGSAADADVAFAGMASSTEQITAPLTAMDEKTSQFISDISGMNESIGTTTEKAGGASQKLGAMHTAVGLIDEKATMARDRMGELDEKITLAGENATLAAEGLGNAEQGVARIEQQAGAAQEKLNQVSSELDKLKDRVVDVTIRIRQERIGAVGGEEEFLGDISGDPVPMQHGFNGVFNEPTLAVFGEGGPEFVQAVPLQGGGTTNSFSMTVNTAATSSTVQQDFQTMAAMSGAMI